jgi:hypothetical protein
MVLTAPYLIATTSHLHRRMFVQNMGFVFRQTTVVVQHTMVHNALNTHALEFHR